MPPPLELQQYLTARRADYDQCLDSIETALTIQGKPANLRFHYLKFTPAGEPMYENLADCIARHILDYCLTAKRRNDAVIAGHSRAFLINEAKELFRLNPTSGEGGELLLYFLQEALLGAPQLVAKMSIKDNPHTEVLGSDGIHGLWDEQNNRLVLYFGESKLYQNLSAAMREAFISISAFHANGLLRHEMTMVTSQFKFLDEAARISLLKFLEGTPRGPVHICHSLLLGHDWARYTAFQGLNAAALTAELQAAYALDAPRWRDTLQGHFDEFPNETFGFEVFMLPFRTVQEFRNAIIAALGRIE